MSNLKKNFIYNVLYQILILILPLITVPYVSRVLGADGIGVYSYTYSIVSYFMMLTLLGINNYGNRTIAKLRDNKIKMSKSFFEIYFVQLMSGIIMLSIYMIYILLVDAKYKEIGLIQSIYILSAIFDINWFFFGLEKFKITVRRSTILKVLSLIMIFIFVKTKNDVWRYTLILSASTLISQLILIPYLIKEIKYQRIFLKDVKKHIKPIIVLFVPVVAISLYKIMDKIMLGSMTTINEVGFYEQAEKIINIPSGIVTALGTVMLPRISNLLSRGKEEEILKYIKKSINFMMFLAFPICFGLISISNDFIAIFMGKEFAKSSILVNYLAITILFVSFANVIRKQYLIPKEMDKTFTFSVILGAILNLFINFILIPIFQSIGACIGTIVAEFAVMIYQCIAVRKKIPIKEYLKEIFPFFIKSILMFIIVLNISSFKMNIYIKLVLQIIIGITVYMLLNIKYVLSIVNVKKTGGS